MSQTEQGRSNTPRRPLARVGLIALAILVIGAAALSVRREPDLSHLDVAIVSGARQGHSHAEVARFAARARQRGGRVRNVVTAGSGENLARLTAPRADVDFGLVQDGADFGGASGIELVARLPHGETLFFLGKYADTIGDYADLRGMRIGAGPEGSGTAQLIDRVLRQNGFDTLGLRVEHAPVASQIDAAARGDLDLAAAVLFEDADLIDRAVRRRGLHIASFASARALAPRLGTGVHAAVLPAGHYDAIRRSPARDVEVLRVDTLLLASERASRSEINGLLTVLARELPGLIEHNRQTVPPEGLAMSRVASEFDENHGPPLVDEYLPRVVDVLPLSNVMTFVMAVSILFNVMGFLNRFRLWRLDVARVKLEGELRELFGGDITRKEIEMLDPKTSLTTERERAQLSELIVRQRELIERCRKDAASRLVPMGGEMVYRYQEDLMIETLAVVRRFEQRLAEHLRNAA